MSEEDWYEDDPREWDLGGAELEYLEEGKSDPEIDESRWHSGEGIVELEWQLEIVQVCLICGRSISLRRKVPPSENNELEEISYVDDGHGDC